MPKNNCKLNMFGVYYIWQKIVFDEVGVDLNKRIPECDYYKYKCAWHLAICTSFRGSGIPPKC